MLAIRLVLFVLLLFVLVYVFAANAGQTVDLRFFGREYLAVGVFWVVAGSFVAGLAVALIGMGLRELRFRSELGRLRRRSSALQRELDDLRALPLQELSEGAGGRER